MNTINGCDENTAINSSLSRYQHPIMVFYGVYSNNCAFCVYICVYVCACVCVGLSVCDMVVCMCGCVCGMVVCMCRCVLGMVVCMCGSVCL